MANMLEMLFAELMPRQGPANPAAEAAMQGATMGMNRPAPPGGPIPVQPGQIDLNPMAKALAAVDQRAKQTGVGMQPPPRATPQPTPSPRMGNPVAEPSQMMTPTARPPAPARPPVPARVPPMPTRAPQAPQPIGVGQPTPAQTQPVRAPAQPMWDAENKVSFPGAGTGGAAMQQGGLLQVLRQALGGENPGSGIAVAQNAMGVGAPAAAPPRTPQPAVAPPSPRGANAGVTGQDVASFFRSLLGGAAAVDPSAPPLSAFAQGGYGAMAGRQKEREKTAAKELAAEEKTYKRGREAAEDKRAASAESRAAAKDRRDARKAEIDNVSAVQKIMREMGGDLTTDQRFKLASEVTDYAKAINPNGFMKPEELEAELDNYRQKLEAQITGRQPAQAGGSAPQPQAGGDGSSRESAARPADKASFDALPSGAWFVNPSDGRLLQKR